MSKKLSFANAIAYMTANPGKEVKNSKNYTYRYYLDKYWRLHRQDKFWQTISGFDLDDVNGQWTIPEPELREVEVVAYLSDEGHLAFAEKDTHGSDYFKNNDRYTKCKIKFNQGEE